jgi:hypothetical protein
LIKHQVKDIHFRRRSILSDGRSLSEVFGDETQPNLTVYELTTIPLLLPSVMIVPTSRPQHDLTDLLMELNYKCDPYTVSEGAGGKQIDVNRYQKPDHKFPFILNPRALNLLGQIQEPICVLSISGIFTIFDHF